MSDPAVSLDRARASELGFVARFFRATELDTRLLGMIGALVVIWIAFQILSGGQFLTPRNLWNLSVQTSSVAVMATGMVLIIVTRNIDLSVGSLLGFIGMIMGVMQTEMLPKLIGFEHPATWIIALGIGIVAGAVIGGFQGFIIAFLGVPAFIVTLGGLLVWRGAAWWVTSGRTVAPMDSTFRLMGGGPEGSIGSMWSWILGILACIAIVIMVANSRRQRQRFNFPRRPVWAEVFMAAISCGLVLGAVAIANAYYWPIGIVRKYAEANNITIPDGGLFISHGIAIPVLIAVATGIIMTFVTTRTRFGRYVFAMGGNPEAADLAGINTRWVTMKIFIIMGILCAIAGAVSTARLNAATNAQGTLDELLTIAAAVIGGTSLAGGVGTIAGAMIGALLMQSLSSGMVLLGLDTPLQNIVVGIVLVIAVWLDTIYRRRTA
ncbi:sugar ABC transporter permease [Phyllobacterium myrsinacearum]|uniref:Xylose transport system permease protein XylH n=1 Tax=Phyllobacterium myrsinacearum TaxID=28101 RepID=A0A2S9JAD4_9HYPH|nr:sugar ABC transporter permease [Phyllobacterium myrsinacearum]PRD49755.1 sugar ABC transporter permease [Phyllobacterium myrsinacearum]PWV94654.1 D-xylose transport system permease protein [Phyllobacterium myrsinacearum]RZS87727.1 D-xylose transport system permease protein [Phyllobacterium myrsinacearum]RZV07237.1 D-xylose transport system permease protein [Phyllobacterium myrsinacearum]